MPWPHCDQEVNDDVPCPTCGITKQEWTVKVEVTRVLRLSGAPTLKLEVKDERGGYVAGARYRVELPDGNLAEGELNPAGYAKATSRVAGDARVTFPELDEDLEAVSAGTFTDDAAPGAWVCRLRNEKHEFVLAPLQVELELGAEEDEAVSLELGAEEDEALSLELGAEEDEALSLELGAEALAPAERQTAQGARAVAIAARDALGAPLAGEPYRIEAPDGAVLREGALDARGRARVEGLEPARVRVVFPRREAAWWEAPTPRAAAPARETPPIAGAVAIFARDAQGAPLANEPYRVESLDGAVLREGALDAGGRARVEGLTHARVKVVFPRREAAWWE